MKKRAFAAFLVVVLFLCLPLSSSLAKMSTDGILRLGTNGIKTNDTVYFGNYLSTPISWRVIGSSAFSDTTVAYGTSVLSLLSENFLTNTMFFSATSDYYPGSALQTNMNAIYNGFLTQEQDAVASTTLSASSLGGEASDLSNQKLFALSELEALALGGNDARVASLPSEAPNWWWLRTSKNETDEFAVSSTGLIFRGSKSYNFGVRPAFHLDQSVVLFSSAAKYGKKSAGVGPGAMTSVSLTDTASEWKLTLLDDSRDGFSIQSTALTDTAASIDYSGAKTGENEYLSAIIEDHGSVIYYGRILQLDGTTRGASGSATINIPSGITLDADTTLKVFNEQYHSDASESPIRTDYSSEFRSVTKPAEIPQTGDSTLPGLWIGIALIAVTGLAVSMLLSRKSKRVF